jgi:gamma-glutamyltranspeptidase/glutathione hydrolase
MKRRQFLQLATASFAAALGTSFTPKATAEHPRPFFDPKRLDARNSNRSTLVCQNGIVCASQPLAAMAGLDILKAGGNCIDAAICTNSTLGLVEPANCGMGGDLFAIVWIEKDKKLYGLNASGRAPYAWNLREAAKLGLKSIPRQSPLAWNVPGCVSGWGALSTRFGKLPLGKCLEAAIDYATKGFPVSPIISTSFDWAEDRGKYMNAVYHPEGKAPKYGEIFTNPMLAKSLSLLAKDGPAAFYEGPIGESIVAKSKELGGFMSMRDLKDHTVKWVDPVSTSYRGWDVWEIPPNGQGISVLQILNILELSDIGSMQPNSAEHLHLLVEAKKLVYEDRAHYYADPEFADVPVEWLISKDYAKQRAKLIDPKRAAVNVPYGDPKLDSDTIYMCAADSEGNMISLIQSNYAGFGSTICPDGVGFVIQNRGQSFALDRKHRNRLEPHKRPFHTIIPAFMTQGGKPVMAYGVMGGDFQPQGHSQVTMNMIDFGMTPQEAGDQPRIDHSGSSTQTGGKMVDGGRITFERGIADDVKLALAGMGHRINPNIDAHGGYQAIWREDNPLRYFGGTESRLDGAAVGW